MLISYIHVSYTSISVIYKIYSQIIHHSEKQGDNNNRKNIFNKNERRCKDVKAQKACGSTRWGWY